MKHSVSFYIGVASLGVLLGVMPVPVSGAPAAGPAGQPAAALFFPTPGRTVLYRLTTVPVAPGQRVDFTVTDYQGRIVLASTAVATSQGVPVASFRLDAGYYELDLPAFSRRFGLICLPDAAAVDPFFCLDAGLSWSGWNPAFKKEMVGILRRKGIFAFRERLAWAGVMPAAGQWKPADYGAVREEVYGGHGRCLLELFHDAPGYVRPAGAGTYPQELAVTRDAWRLVAGKFGGYWDAFEAWNEPNLAPWPADQYLPLVKTLGAAFNGQPAAAGVALVGGCFNPGAPAAYLDACADNGMLDVVDAVSFHIYTAPEGLLPVVKFYRDWLQRQGRPDFPLWISEAGVAWPTNPEGRPAAEEGRAVAATHAMRGVEAFAGGVERYYPFYLQKHVEGSIAWGMTGTDGSPLPALGSWLYAAQRLAGKTYVGDMPELPAGLSRARVFQDARETVAVLYGPPSGKPLRLTVPALALHGADGRRLPLPEDGAVVNPDGLLYVTTRLEAPARQLRTDGDAMALFRRKGTVARTALARARQVVIRPIWHSGQAVQVSNTGYWLDPSQVAHCRFSAEVNNLGNQAAEVVLKMGLPAGAVLLAGRTDETLRLPVAGRAVVSWTLNLRGALAATDRVKVRLTAETVGAPGKPLDAAVLVLGREPARDVYVIPRARRSPVVDGRAAPGEWDDVPVLERLTVHDDSSHGAVLTVPAADLSGNVRFQWDDNGLHYLVTVMDDRHVQTQSPDLSWMQDSLQLAYWRENAGVAPDQFEWGFSRDAAGPRSIAFSTSTGKPLSPASRIAIRRDDQAGQTVYEGLLSWADLGSMSAIGNKENQRLRLTLLVNDCDGAGRKWLELSPGIADDKNANAFPEFILSPASPTCLVRTAGLVLPAAAGQSLVKQLNLPALAARTPLTVSARLDGRSCKGFQFTLALLHATTGEGYAAWCADSNVFAEQTGFAIVDRDGTVIALGKAGEHLDFAAGPQQVTLWFDPVTQRLKLSVAGVGGVERPVAEGTGARWVSAIGRISLEAALWHGGTLAVPEVKTWGTPTSADP